MKKNTWALGLKITVSFVSTLSVLLSIVSPTFSANAQAKEAVLESGPAPLPPEYKLDFSEYDPPLGTYTYTVGWEGIPAAEATISVARDEGNYRVVATAKTYSGIDIFYRLRYRAEGLLTGSEMLPIKTTIDQEENSKVKNSEITFHDDGRIEAVRETKGKPIQVVDFTPESYTLDPFSAAFIARGVDWKVGDTKTFSAFNGKTRYKIVLSAVGTDTIEVNGVDREVWDIMPKVYDLTDDKLTKKLREAHIFVTTDSKREILKISSSVFIGSVTTELDSFEPLPDASKGLQVAQNGAHRPKSSL